MNQIYYVLISILTIALNRISDSPVTYDVTYIGQTKLSNQFGGEFSLICNDVSSIFKNISIPKDDEIIDDGSLNIQVKSGDPDGYAIYRNINENVIESKFYIGKKSNSCIIKDSIPLIKWKIFNETKEVSGIKVTKAFCKFGGREYDVWFAPSIGIQHGPFYFSGLPGLILEVKSRDNKINIVFKTIKKTSNYNKITSLSSTLKIQCVSHSEYIKMRDKIREKIKIDVAARGGKFEVSQDDWQIYKGYL